VRYDRRVVALAHTERGSGARSVIMLHGFLGSGRNLGSLARLWSERDPSITVVLPDLRGHGASPPLERAADLATLAQDVLDLVAALRIERPIDLVGHSLGGRVALMARMIDASAVRSVVLLDISPSPARAAVSSLQPVLEALLQAPDRADDRARMLEPLSSRGVSKSIVDWLSTNLVPDGGGYVWRFDRRALSELHEQTIGVDLWPTVETPGAKIALVRGADSLFVSPEDVERFVRAGRAVRTVEGAGHFLHVDRPREVVDALMEIDREAA
jgi:pimeloyl-ACP methyl ester carboxylesterase